MMTPEAHDDIELSDRENDTFLPSAGRTSWKGEGGNVSTRWLPRRLRTFVETLSTIKLVILLLGTFLVFLGLLSYWNKGFKAVSIPRDSIKLAQELAKNLSDTTIPSYVLEYAPFVFLDKGEVYYPSDIATHLASTYPTVNFTRLDRAPESLTMSNLDMLNEISGNDVYLTSSSPLIKMPSFLNGQKPNPKTLQTENAISCVVIVVDKGAGIVDAFYMYFYTFNDGPSALGHKVGNHLGDWEHNMIRFKSGNPEAVWYSQHSYGEAVEYRATHKLGKRPVAFSARGSHANYLTGADHDLSKEHPEIPKRIVYDRASQSVLWDPTLSAYYYAYSTESLAFTPAKDDMPTGYLYFRGKWGDQEYPDDAEGQEEFHGFRKWTGGPEGPLFKCLDREDVCWTSERECVIKTELD